ncbi:hypothetical protein D3C83_54360 [compost metagenome]
MRVGGDGPGAAGEDGDAFGRRVAGLARPADLVGIVALDDFRFGVADEAPAADGEERLGHA